MKKQTGSISPMLALTADALRGESDRAALVGMDTYLVKPVQLPKLQAALETWLPVSQQQEESSVIQDVEHAADSTDVLLNPMVLSELVRGDEQVINELLGDYLESVRGHAHAVVQAWQAHDLNKIASVAHKLKSSSRSVGALPLGELCAKLEQAVKSNRHDDVEPCLQVFAEQVDATLQAIEKHIDSAGERLTRMLVVDDNPFMCHLRGQQLAKVGLRKMWWAQPLAPRGAPAKCPEKNNVAGGENRGYFVEKSAQNGPGKMGRE